jgi:hypothetical protein
MRGVKNKGTRIATYAFKIELLARVPTHDCVYMKRLVC